MAPGTGSISSLNGENTKALSKTVFPGEEAMKVSGE